MSRERRREIDRESRFLDVDIARAGAGTTIVRASILRLVRGTLGVGSGPDFEIGKQKLGSRVNKNGPDFGVGKRP